MAYLPYSRHSKSKLVREFLEGKDTIFGEIKQRFGKKNQANFRGKIWYAFREGTKAGQREDLEYICGILGVDL